MPVFRFTAYEIKNPANVLPPQTIEADNEYEANNIIRRMGYFPIDVEEVIENRWGSLAKTEIGSKKVSDQQLAYFTKDLSIMVKAGVPVTESLDAASQSTKNKLLRATIENVLQLMQQGSGLSTALEQHPNVFDEMYISLVKSGETGGDLAVSLSRIALQLESRAKLKREIKSAMMYPSMVISFAFAVVIVMLLFITPTFAKVFSESGASLPAPTQVLVKLSDFLKAYWFLMPIIGFGGVWSWRHWLSTETGRWKWDSFKLKAPMGIGSLNQKIVTARFARTFEILFAAGVPLLEVLEKTGPTTNNVVIKKALEDAGEEVQKGGSLSMSLKKSDVFSIDTMKMIETGEKTGELPKMMENLAESYEEQVEVAIKGLKSLMEPISIIVIGGIIGCIVVALYLPIFKVYDQIK